MLRLLRDDLRRHPGAAMAVAATFALAAASLGACRRLAVVAAAGPALALLPALGAIAAAGALVAALALRRARRSAEIGLMLALGFTRGAAFLPAIASVVVAALAGGALGLCALDAGWSALGAGLAPPRPSPAEHALWLAAVLAAATLAGYLTVRAPDPSDDP